MADKTPIEWTDATSRERLHDLDRLGMDLQRSDLAEGRSVGIPLGAPGSDRVAAEALSVSGHGPREGTPCRR